LGLKPGIWVAPYAIAEHADLVQRHPEWLAHDASGNLQATASTRVRYILDITHPGAQRWLQQLFETIAHEWGYDFIKIDFVEWTLLAIAHYYDPTMSRAQAYRLGFEIMRRAIGPHRHLLDCGPGPETVGLLDSMRIEQDLPRTTWEQYAKYSSSTAPAVAKRYYFHQRTWINDADHVGLALLTIPQAEAVASLIALSGGTVISGDRLYALDDARLNILKKILPAYGEAARPLDLFEQDRPELFALHIQKAFGAWWLVGYFNWHEDAEVRREFAVSSLGLDPQKSYLVYTFWPQRLLAETNNTVSLQFAPASVHLLAIHEKHGVPQVLSTDRHYTQGALELEDVHWDAKASILSGMALGAAGLCWTLTVYVPEGFRWDPGQDMARHEDYTIAVGADESHLLRLQLTFVCTDRVPWSLRFLTI
jgi:alpha-galactosidase